MQFRKSLKIRLMFVCHKWFDFDCQKKVMDVVLAGHNTCIAGADGSGKSFLLKQISEHIRRKLVRSFIPCHFIILGERSATSENLRIFPPIPDFHNFGSRLRTKKFKMAATKHGARAIKVGFNL